MNVPRLSIIITVFATVVVLAVVASSAKASNGIGRVSTTLTGADIPSFLHIPATGIFAGSDTLRLNDSILIRDHDYHYDSIRRGFDLSGLALQSSDTLTIIYTTLPSWFKTEYGRTIAPVDINGRSAPTTPAPLSGFQSTPNRGSDVTISGSKAFRFDARSNASSQFNQSIDLAITGELSPGLEISGAVSDRGYNPSYGTANSRLNELDKINMRLRSKAVLVQLGDIALTNRFAPNGPAKFVSGVSAEVSQERFHVEAAAARPKGRFESSRFQGSDNLQGPYQIIAGNISGPIVPGSEKVWLDGRLLSNGAGKDYVMDYPTGRITFNANHPIDSRSRIEIDYEPQATAYKQELIRSGGGATFGDSTLSFDIAWQREGDDNSQPLAGELSQSERDLLKAAGDNPSAAYKSGVTADSAGNYDLDQTALPDSIYVFVGDNNGDYRVRFTYVGEQQGDYHYLGGDNYQFIGVAQGEYLPIIALTLPEQNNNYLATVRHNSRLIGRTDLDLRHSEYDANTLSSIGDNNNSGTYYDLSNQRQWQHNDRRSLYRLNTRYREADFRSRTRLNHADFDRAFFLPERFIATSTERRHSFESTLNPVQFIQLNTSAAYLNYKNQFESKRYAIASDLFITKHTTLSGGVEGVDAALDTSATSRDGTVRHYSSGLSHELSDTRRTALTFTSDKRTNEYASDKRGTRYMQLTWSYDQQTERLEFEYFAEDTLTNNWRDNLTRSRITLNSARQLGPLRYDFTGSYQHLDQNGTSDDFLTRLSYRYRNNRHRLDMNGSYLLSDENQNARGITYLAVESGQGDYIFEDGQHIPEAGGDFIRVDELLSERQAIKRGEKSFYFSKDWRAILIRFDSNIKEELLNDGERDALWAIPFWTDLDQPYLFFNRRYQGEIKLVPLRLGYGAEISLRDDREIRDISSTRYQRRDSEGALTLRQIYGSILFEQHGRIFESKRDNYYSGAGDVTGFAAGARVRHVSQRGETAIGAIYRKADDANIASAKSITAELQARLRNRGVGELRSKLELYRQQLEGDAQSISYILTDNRPGKWGALWSISVNYSVRKGTRINLSINGRHADNRTARVTARGEMVIAI